MNASSGHPGRPLFDSNWSPGILSTLVLEEHERNPNDLPTPDEMRRIFTEGEVPALAKMVDHLETEHGRSVTEFGSGSIDLEGVTRGEFTIERALRLQELYIGNARRGITPMAWLGYLARRFDDVPGPLRSILERVIGQMNMINAVIARGGGREIHSFDDFIEQVRYDAPFN